MLFFTFVADHHKTKDLTDLDLDPLPAVLQNTLFSPITFEIVIQLIVLAVLLVCSALVSASEVAFFSLKPSQLSFAKGKEPKSITLIRFLLDAPKRLLATILITNNFINVGIVVLSTYITIQLFNLAEFPILAFFIQVVIITSLILIMGEIIPKIYATQQALKMAKFMSRPLQFLSRLFYPISLILVNSTNFIDKRIGRKGHQISRSELNEAIEITSNDNTQEDERKILQGIVKFGDIEVSEIMKSRTDVVAIDIETNFDDLLQIIRESGYSRMPVYTETFDKIEGVLYIKDLLAHIGESEKFEWSKLIRPAFFVPENKKINDLLSEFQEKKIHLAIVVDEYGGTSGIVTLEDVLEEIVGEISDEFDVIEDEIPFTKINDTLYLFEGKTMINDFCKVIDIDDDIFDEVKGDSDSLAGLILEMEGRIPKKGEKTTFREFNFTVEAVDNRRIKQVLIEIKTSAGNE